MARNGDILVDSVEVGSNFGQVSLSSTGSILEAGAGDAEADLKGAVSVLVAKSAIAGLENGVSQRFEFNQGKKVLFHIDRSVELFLMSSDRVDVHADGHIVASYVDSKGTVDADGYNLKLYSGLADVHLRHVNAGLSGQIMIRAQGDKQLGLGNIYLPHTLFNGDDGYVFGGQKVEFDGKGHMYIDGVVESASKNVKFTSGGEIYVGGDLRAGNNVEFQALGLIRIEAGASLFADQDILIVSTLGPVEVLGTLQAGQNNEGNIVIEFPMN
jgi:hypothetical protein